MSVDGTLKGVPRGATQIRESPQPLSHQTNVHISYSLACSTVCMHVSPQITAHHNQPATLTATCAVLLGRLSRYSHAYVITHIQVMAARAQCRIPLEELGKGHLLTGLHLGARIATLDLVEFVLVTFNWYLQAMRCCKQLFKTACQFSLCKFRIATCCRHTTVN